MLEVKYTGQRGHVATKGGLNVLEVEKLALSVS